MKSFALVSLALASALPSVFAHGFVDKIIVSGGKTYTGPEPGDNSASSSIIRLIDSTDPNHIDDGKNLACGKGAATRGAKLTGNANPGDTLSFNWNAGDGTPWPHDSGPLVTYMAKCYGDCSSFDATQGKYFKIDQIGKTQVPGNDWFQNTILRKGKMYDVKLPDDLPAGDYLIRHEIIALHLADQLKGAEFYPSCSQFTIGGSNTGSPNVTASFPGAYKATDPGIHINIWDQTDNAYPYPGPAIASFSGSSSSGSNTSSNSTSTATASSSNSSVSNSSSDNNSNDNSSSDDGSSSSNDANADSGSNDSNSDDGCDDQGNDTNNNSAASGTNDSNSNDNASTASTASTTTADPNVVYKTVTVTETVTVTPKVRLARETSSAERRSRMHRPRKHSS